jgi:hypothetical protein
MAQEIEGAPDHFISKGSPAQRASIHPAFFLRLQIIILKIQKLKGRTEAPLERTYDLPFNFLVFEMIISAIRKKGDEVRLSGTATICLSDHWIFPQFRRTLKKRSHLTLLLVALFPRG